MIGYARMTGPCDPPAAIGVELTTGIQEGLPNGSEFRLMCQQAEAAQCGEDFGRWSPVSGAAAGTAHRQPARHTSTASVPVLKAKTDTPTGAPPHTRRRDGAALPALLQG